MTDTEIKILIEISRQIKVGMKKKQVTQKKLAKNINVSEKHLSHILNAKFNPGFLLIWKISEFLDLELSIEPCQKEKEQD